MMSRAATMPRRGTRPVSRRPRALAEWLAEHGEPVDTAVKITRITAGRTNVISAVRDGADHHWVLRERRIDAVRDFAREAGIVRALSGQALPVARLVGHRPVHAGVPFMVTARVPGLTVHTEEDARLLTSSQRRALGFQVVATLAALHEIRPTEVGLLPSRTGYVDRQLACMTDVWTRSGTSTVHDSAWRAIRSRLIERRPLRRSRTTLVHGDFRLSNLVLDDGAVSAVVDWDWCTVGDPVADLAWLLTTWRGSDDPAACVPLPTRVGGFPTRREMVTAYCEATGHPVDGLAYHRGMAHWRAATLLQAEVARQVANVLDDETPALDVGAVEETIAELLIGAATFLHAAT